MIDEKKRYRLVVWCILAHEGSEFFWGEREMCELGERAEIALMAGEYWAKKFPQDIVMLVEKE